MKVVFYSTSAEDLVRYRLPVALRLREAGYTILFAGSSGVHAAEIEDQGFDYRRLPPSLEKTGPARDTAAGARLGRIYRQDEPDIVHNYSLHGLARGALAARMAGVSWVVQSVPPLINQARASRLLKPGGRRLLRMALRDAEVTFRTHEDRQTLLSMGCVRPEQTHIIASSGLDLASYPVTDEPHGPPVVAMIGLLQDQDALEAFAGAARIVREKELRARFVLVSTGRHAPNVPRSRLNEWIEDGLIESWGSRDDAASILPKVHVVCALEDQARAHSHLLLESAASGRPVVSVRSTRSVALVRDGETGRLTPLARPDHLAEAFIELLCHAGRRTELGANARRLVESEFSAHQVAQQTMAVYERLFMRGREI